MNAATLRVGIRSNHFIAFMDTNSATAKDQLREAIDDEIKVSEQVIQELKYRRNALAPISRLPPETLAEIFSLLPFSAAYHEGVPYLEWIRVAHACHRWREIALRSPYFWSHINYNKLSLAGITEILTRAKMSPLHFEVDTTYWGLEWLDAFGRQLEAHISHTRHLSITGFITVLEQLVSPPLALESLSLTATCDLYMSSKRIIPDSLFNGTAPNLACLELIGCSIGWKSPLLKGLQSLKIVSPSEQVMPTLEDWLAGLNEMSGLKTLILDNATPTISVDDPLISEPQRTVTLPSLTHFNITTSSKRCALALAHLVLPALVSLHVKATSQSWDGDDVRSVTPHVARHVHGSQDTAPLQTILFNGAPLHAEIVAWTVPDADVEVCNLFELYHVVDYEKAPVSARLIFHVRPEKGSRWREGTESAVFDAMLSHLPLDTISTLSALNVTRLSKEIWLSHAPRLTKLKRALLVPTAVRAFRQMLEEDTPPNGLPRLPQLTKLILSEVVLTVPRTYHLRDMLVKRKEQGAPLEALDLRTCIGTHRGFQLLSETVDNVQVPERSSVFSNCEGRLGPFAEEEERTDDDEYDDDQ